VSGDPQLPRVPGTGIARAFVWAALAASVATAAADRPRPPAWRVASGPSGCRLASAGSGRPCPCESWPGRLRLLLGQPLDVNRAGVEDLQAIPGIGAARAAVIVAARDTQGPFRSLDDLGRLPGVGRGTLARLRGRLTSEDPCADPEVSDAAASAPRG
jgi:competence ComEA-like helix-hairpin-helix protein